MSSNTLPSRKGTPNSKDVYIGCSSISSVVVKSPNKIELLVVYNQKWYNAMAVESKDAYVLRRIKLTQNNFQFY